MAAVFEKVQQAGGTHAAVFSRAEFCARVRKKNASVPRDVQIVGETDWNSGGAVCKYRNFACRVDLQ